MPNFCVFIFLINIDKYFIYFEFLLKFQLIFLGNEFENFCMEQNVHLFFLRISLKIKKKNRFQIKISKYFNILFKFFLFGK